MLLFLAVWFFIWGICPWNSASSVAQAAQAAHAEHGHHGEADDTHHASKGTEHSCTGSISYSIKVKHDRPPDDSTPIQDLISPVLPADRAVSLRRGDGLPTLLLERHTLPKRLTEYYQLYSVYRI